MGIDSSSMMALRGVPRDCAVAGQSGIGSHPSYPGTARPITGKYGMY